MQSIRVTLKVGGAVTMATKSDVLTSTQQYCLDNGVQLLAIIRYDLLGVAVVYLAVSGS